MKQLLYIPRLMKYKLCLAVTLTGAVGYLMFTGAFDSGLALTAAGIFLLAGGSAALNQLQENRYDKLMPRTDSRPLPAGNVSQRFAVVTAMISVVTGASLLWIVNPLSAGIGLLNLLFYNTLYTPLKRSTYLAIIPGAVVGALPPLIGWTAAGGAPFASPVLFVAILIFLWQVPHFWLLIIRYVNEYHRAGYPTIMKLIDEESVIRIVYLWIIVSSLFAMSFPLFGIVAGPVIPLLLVVSGLLFMAAFTWLLFGRTRKTRKAFILSNIYLTCLYILIALGALLA